MNIRVSYLLIFIFLPIFATSASSSALDDAVNLFENGQHSESQELFLSLVDGGDGVAARYLGIIEQFGLVGAPNHEYSIAWFKQAVQFGDTISNRFLGYAFLDGEVIDRDLERAAYYFERAAVNGDTYGAYEFARILYDVGNIDEAKKYYALAANMQYDKAQFELAIIMLEQGDDISEAIKLLNSAADVGNADAKLFLGAIALAEMTPELSKETGIKYIEEAAENNNLDALNLLGSMHFEGTILEKNIMESMDFLRLSHANGSEAATLLLATIYHDFGDKDEVVSLISSVSSPDDKSFYLKSGKFLHDNGYKKIHYDVIKNLYLLAMSYDIKDAGFWAGNLIISRDGETNEALDAYYFSYKHGHPEAGFIIANACLTNNHKICENIDSFELIKELALSGNMDAQLMMGNFLSQEKDNRKAVEAADWFLKSADQGNAVAMHNLGVIYLTGSGVKEDLDAAVHWFTLAAENDYDPAREYLDVLIRD